jgi:tetratricopeptide (TPR) repeat protein
VDYLADEFNRRLRHLPDEVLFLQGMAARARRDKRNEEKYFRQVWERGHYGYIYAVAAHNFGLLIRSRDRQTAERAVRDSIQWDVSDYGRAMAYHSLGNLLARDRKRWDEAEQAYRHSLDNDKDDQSRAETLHSLGNLLAKDRRRWHEAEQAYSRSIELDKNASSRAETLHSLGKLLFKIPSRRDEAESSLEQSFRLDTTSRGQAQVLATRAAALLELNDDESYRRAEEYALRGIELDSENPRTSGICYRVLTGIYEKRRDYRKAIESAEGWKKTEERLGEDVHARRVQSKIDEFRRKMKEQR